MSAEAKGAFKKKRSENLGVCCLIASTMSRLTAPSVALQTNLNCKCHSDIFTSQISQLGYLYVLTPFGDECRLSPAAWRRRQWRGKDFFKQQVGTIKAAASLHWDSCRLYGKHVLLFFLFFLRKPSCTSLYVGQIFRVLIRVASSLQPCTAVQSAGMDL